jgi:hypothetical protein
MEVVLPATMTVRDSHDISLDLQHKVGRPRECACINCVSYVVTRGGDPTGWPNAGGPRLGPRRMH